MKMNVLFLVGYIILVFAAVITLFIIFDNPNIPDDVDEIVVDLTDVNSFVRTRYRIVITNANVNIYLQPNSIVIGNVGVIDNQQIAIRRARDIFREYFPHTFNENNPVMVSYDAGHWLLRGHSRSRFIDGSIILQLRHGYYHPVAIVRSDGDILAVWKPFALPRGFVLLFYWLIAFCALFIGMILSLLIHDIIMHKKWSFKETRKFALALSLILSIAFLI